MERMLPVPDCILFACFAPIHQTMDELRALHLPTMSIRRLLTVQPLSSSRESNGLV
jgi:hypothetical protein